LLFIPADWFFVSHFLPMARAARAAGFDVVVATRVDRHRERILADDCRLIPLKLDRGSLAPLGLLRGVAELSRIVRSESPDIVHCIALPTVVPGGLAAKSIRATALVLAPTGLGYLSTSNTLSARIMRPPVRATRRR